MEWEILEVVEFSRRFGKYRELFERDTILSDDEIGVWITAILPEAEAEAERIFCEEAGPTSDPIRFVVELRGEKIFGEADYYLEPKKIFEIVKRLVKNSNIFICSQCGREITWGRCPICGNEQEDACAGGYCSECPICGVSFEPFCAYCEYVKPVVEEEAEEADAE